LPLVRKGGYVLTGDTCRDTEVPFSDNVGKAWLER